MAHAIRYLERALSAWERGEIPDAIRSLRKAANKVRSAPDLWAALADLEFGADLYHPAIRHYRRALVFVHKGRRVLDDRGPLGRCVTEPRLHLSLGSVLAAAGDLEGAETSLRRAVSLDPTAEPRVALGELLEAVGRPTEARRQYVRALRSDRESVTALLHLGCFHQWSAPGRAERYMRRVLRRDPRDAQALCSLGLLLTCRQEWKTGERMLRDAARQVRSSQQSTSQSMSQSISQSISQCGALPFVYLGHNLQHQGRDKEAENAYLQAQEIDPGDPHPLFALGDLHRLAGRDRRAEEAYREALRVDPSSADAALRLGCLLDDQGHASEARTLLHKGLELAPAHPWQADVRERLQEPAG